MGAAPPPSFSSGAASLRERLRARTHAPHRRLEDRLPLLAPDLTLKAYREILTALWGYHRPLEDRLEAVDAWGRLGLGAGERGRRRDWLSRDLGFLGLDSPSIETLPTSDVLPPLSDDSDRLGCIYVVEGATLGGRRILAHLRKRIGVAPGRGGDFFHGHGRTTGARWREVTDRIGAWEDRSAGELNRVLDGAEATFLTLEHWLGTRGVLR